MAPAPERWLFAQIPCCLRTARHRLVESMFSFYLYGCGCLLFVIGHSRTNSPSPHGVALGKIESDFKIRLQYLIHWTSRTTNRTSATNNKRPNRTETPMMYGIAAFSLFIISM